MKQFNNSVQGAGYVNAVKPAKKDDEKNRVFFIEVNNSITKTTYNVRYIAKDADEAKALRAMGDDCFENLKNAKVEGYEHKTHTMAFSGIFQPGVYNKEKNETSPDTIAALDIELEPTLKGRKLSDEKCEFAGNVMSVTPKEINGKEAVDVVIGVHFGEGESAKTERIQSLIFKNEKEGAYEQMAGVGVGDFIRLKGEMSSRDGRMFINPTNVIMIQKKAEKAEAQQAKAAPAAKTEKKTEKKAEPKKRVVSQKKKGQSLA